MAAEFPLNRSQGRSGGPTMAELAADLIPPAGNIPIMKGLH